MQITTKPEINKILLRSLSQPTIWPWLQDALLDWLVIAGTYYLTYIWTNPLSVLAALLIIGNRQHALAVLGHDGAHFTLSNRNRKLNDVLTNLFAMWPIGLTVSGYRALHFRHHHSTGTEHDPELAHKHARSPQWDLPATSLRVLKYACYDLIGYSFPDYIIIFKFSKPASRMEYLPLFCFNAAIIMTLLASGLWWVMLLWYSALVTSFMMFFRLRLWLEHQGTPGTHRLHLNFWQAALLAPHKAWLHWEHHSWMAVPYHRLEKLRKHIAGEPVLTLAELLAWFHVTGNIPSGKALAA